MHDKDFLTTVEVCRMLDVSKPTVILWIHQGEFVGTYQLNPLRKTSPYRIPRHAVEAFIKRRSQHQK